MSEETKIADKTLWDEVVWDKVAFNKVDKLTFLRILALNKKAYATFLGNQEQLQFYMFKPVSWGIFKELRNQKANKEELHEKIITECVIWPKIDVMEFNTMDAGVVLTLVHQILAVSNFLKNPDKALEMILEVK